MAVAAGMTAAASFGPGASGGTSSSNSTSFGAQTASGSRLKPDPAMAGALQLLKEDIQALKSVKTVAQVANAVVQLSQDLSNLRTVPTSASSSANSTWRMAFEALIRALPKLQKLAPANADLSSQNPLKTLGQSSTDAVKSILDDLNSAYGLLQKVATDLAPLLTYTVTVNWSNDGTVRSSPGIGNRGIACGGPLHTCHAAFLDFIGAGFSFSGFFQPPRRYSPRSVTSLNGAGCVSRTLRLVIGTDVQYWDCDLIGGTRNVNLTVTWRILPTTPAG